VGYGRGDETHHAACMELLQLGNGGTTAEGATLHRQRMRSGQYMGMGRGSGCT